MNYSICSLPTKKKLFSIFDVRILIIANKNHYLFKVNETIECEFNVYIEDTSIKDHSIIRFDNFNLPNREMLMRIMIFCEKYKLNIKIASIDWNLIKRLLFLGFNYDKPFVWMNMTTDISMLILHDDDNKNHQFVKKKSSRIFS